MTETIKSFPLPKTPNIGEFFNGIECVTQAMWNDLQKVTPALYLYPSNRRPQCLVLEEFIENTGGIELFVKQIMPSIVKAAKVSAFAFVHMAYIKPEQLESFNTNPHFDFCYNHEENNVIMIQEETGVNQEYIVLWVEGNEFIRGWKVQGFMGKRHKTILYDTTKFN